jgi:competence protein ComGC
MTKKEFRIPHSAFRVCGSVSGFTLMEAIIIIVLVGIFMAAIGIPFLSGIRESHIPEIISTAHFLAVEEQEHLANLDYSALTPGTWALENPISGFPGYSRQVVVANVDANLNPSGSDVGYRTVTVTVYHNDLAAAGMSIETLRTDY